MPAEAVPHRLVPPAISAPTPMLDADAISCFERDGYLSLEGLTDAADIDALRRIAIDLFDRRAGLNEGAYFDLTGRDARGQPAGLPQILDPRSHAPALLRSRFYRRATALARELLGPRARFRTDHILLKPALHGASTPWHQDEAFRDPAFETTEISIWLPLQPVGRHNGCLTFIPGSHRSGTLTHRSVGGDPHAHGLECLDGFDPDTAVSCPLPIGGCTVHAGGTVHGAGPNASHEPRYAYVLVFELPPSEARERRRFEWLEQRDPASERRRRHWMRRGGFLLHAFRRARQIRQVGPLVLCARLGRKLARTLIGARRARPGHWTRIVRRP